MNFSLMALGFGGPAPSDMLLFGNMSEPTPGFSLELSSDLREMRDWVHEFAAQVIRPAAAEWDEREQTPWPILQEAAKVGLYCIEMLQTADMSRGSNTDTIFAHYPCDRVLVGNPHVTNPLLDATEIEVTGRDAGRISAATGHGSYGEAVRLTRNKAGKVTEVWFAGGKGRPEKAVAAEMERRYGRGKRKR